MEEKQWTTKASGEQQHFNTGAKRDTQKGKGRFDLLPIHAMRMIAHTYAQFGKNTSRSKKELSNALSGLYECLSFDTDVDIDYVCSKTVWYIFEYMEVNDVCMPKYEKCDVVGYYRYDLIPYVSLKRVADVFERGANLYGSRNWENGMNLSRLLDSAIRHLHQAIADKDDEDHLAASAWNVMAFIETKWRIDNGYLPKELNDLPTLKKIGEGKGQPTITPHTTGSVVIPDSDGLSFYHCPYNNPLLDHYGSQYGVKPLVINDGYGCFDYNERNKTTLFGSIVGSPSEKK